MVAEKVIKLHYGGHWTGRKEGLLSVCEYEGGAHVECTKEDRISWKSLIWWVKQNVWWHKLGNVRVSWIDNEKERMPLTNDCTCEDFWERCVPNEEGCLNVYSDIVDTCTGSLIGEPEDDEEIRRQKQDAAEADEDDSGDEERSQLSNSGEDMYDSEQEARKPAAKKGQGRPNKLPLRRIPAACLSEEELDEFPRVVASKDGSRNNPPKEVVQSTVGPGITNAGMFILKELKLILNECYLDI